VEITFGFLLKQPVPMNIFATILICAPSVPIQACDESAALSVIVGPSAYSQPDQCQIDLLAYVANSGLVHKDDVAKVY